MGNKIVIDDGLKIYDIENQDGKLLGRFSFNPSDTNIIHRYSEILEALEKLNMDAPGGAESEDAGETKIEEKLKSVEKVIYEKIDYLLNADATKEFFSVMGPLSPLANGQFYVESVLEAIGQAIQAETGQRVQKVNGKIRKHTSKYHG